MARAGQNFYFLSGSAMFEGPRFSNKVGFLDTRVNVRQQHNTPELMPTFDGYRKS